ncbi:MAG: helix-turn-helix domain-containing protein [Gemmatimonadota bacterium]
MLLKYYLEAGRPVTEISRELDVSRQTIYRWIRRGELGRDIAELHYQAAAPLILRG